MVFLKSGNKTRLITISLITFYCIYPWPVKLLLETLSMSICYIHSAASTAKLPKLLKAELEITYRGECILISMVAHILNVCKMTQFPEKKKTMTNLAGYF